MRSGSATRSLRVMPDGCADLFVTTEGSVMVAGPATAFYDLRADNGSVLAGLRLRPGAAAAVLGRSASDVKDHQVAIDSVFGVAGSRLAENLFGTTTSRQRVMLLEDALAAYFGVVEPVVDQPVARAVEMLRIRPDQPVSSLASAVGLSERQLRRRFRAAVGYGPKRLGRIFRFQRLMDLIHAADDRMRWAELAIEAGYADQSHMINECLVLAGAPPTVLPDVSVLSNTGTADSP
jgi:AraC-like DNA-binding protein